MLFPGSKVFCLQATNFEFILKIHRIINTTRPLQVSKSSFATGKDVLAFSKAENGSGESNIITQGISLKPLEIKSMAVTVTESASQELTINFAANRYLLMRHCPVSKYGTVFRQYLWPRR